MKIVFSDLYKTKSNLLSTLRLLCAIPFFFLLRSWDHHYLVAALTVFCVITDLLDGYLARKFNEITEMGKIIDPLADKVCIGVVVLQLFLLDKISDWYFYLIIGRDIIIFLGGIYVTKKINRVLPSDYVGKSTVIFIGMVILLTLMGVEDGQPLFMFFYYGSIFLTIFSLVNYAQRAIKAVTTNKHQISNKKFKKG